MDNLRHGIRASGDYAIFNGREYFARELRSGVRLLSDDDPPPPGFQTSKKSWVRSETVIDKERVEGLYRVTTTCRWRTYPFRVGIIVGDIAYVTYLGTDFDEVCRLPGMDRPDKFEIIGEIPVSEISDVEEEIVEVPLPARSDNDNPERSRE
jgi:hypothetical protein